MKKCFNLSFLWTISGLFSFCFAGLNWETQEVSHVATLSESEYEAVFAFTNDSDAVVTITGTRASCGCTVPSIDKKTFEPGESGEIKALFRYGSRVGEQRKRVTVTTDDGATYALMLAVSIPEPVKLQPRVLMWNREAETAPKRAQIVLDPAYEVELQGVNALSNDFTAALTQDQGDGSWWVEVQPVSSNARMRTQVVLQAGLPGEEPRNYALFVGVR